MNLSQNLGKLIGSPVWGPSETLAASWTRIFIGYIHRYMGMINDIWIYIYIEREREGMSLEKKQLYVYLYIYIT